MKAVILLCLVLLGGCTSDGSDVNGNIDDGELVAKYHLGYNITCFYVRTTTQLLSIGGMSCFEGDLINKDRSSIKIEEYDFEAALRSCEVELSKISPNHFSSIECSLSDYLDGFTEGYAACSSDCYDYVATNSCERCEFYKCKRKEEI